MLTQARVKRENHATEQSVQGWKFNGASRGLLSIIDLYQRASKCLQQTGETNSFALPLSLLREMLAALHYRDENTFYHSRRVSLIATGIANLLCWNKQAIKELEIASLLHDIGKIGVPDYLLYKPGRFTTEESGQMSLSVEVAENILQVCQVPPEVRQILLDSRRCYSGLEDYSRPVGTDICQGARILAVADAFESLSREQVFRDAKQVADIIEFLRKQSGTKYDPRVIDTLVRWIQGEGNEILRTQEQKESSGFQATQNSLIVGALNTIFAELYAIEQVYDGLIILDAEQNVILANRGCMELFHHRDQLFRPQPWKPELFMLQNFNHEDFAADAHPIEAVQRQRRPISSNVQIPGPQRHGEAAEIQSLPLFDVDGIFQGTAHFLKCKDRQRGNMHQFKELALQASRDALTGIANRGELENQLANLMDRRLKDEQGSTFSVIYLDIDHFKSINDRYGHAVGDEVLISLARLLKEEVFSNELVARYGGEEFVVLCPDLELMQAAARAERFRQEILKLRFESTPGLKISSSFGVAQIESNDTLENVLKRADKALYESKNAGRNRTTVLKREEISKSLETSKPSPKLPDYVFKTEIKGVLYDEFLVMKMKGFVQEHRARILEVKKGYAKVRLGRKGFFSGWGRKPENQPVVIELQSQTEIRRTDGLGRNSQLLDITITPAGLAPNQEVFLSRARLVYRMLREHFVSE